MKLYRSMDFKKNEFIVDNGKLYVLPKPFESNIDSTISSGVYSFWFNLPIKLSNFTKVVVESDFEPTQKGTMYFSSKVDEDEDGFAIYENYEIDEYVTDKPIEIKKIYLNRIYSIEYLFSVLHKEQYEKYRKKDFLSENFSEIYPHFKKDVFYYWGSGYGCYPKSFIEIITNKKFQFDYKGTFLGISENDNRIEDYVFSENILKNYCEVELITYENCYNYISDIAKKS